MNTLYCTLLLIFAVVGAALFARSVVRVGYAGAAAIAADDSQSGLAVRRFVNAWIELSAGGALMALCSVKLAECLLL